MMDEPVFLKDQFEVKYNFSHLRYALFDKDGIKNLLTTSSVTVADICHDKKLACLKITYMM